MNWNSISRAKQSRMPPRLFVRYCSYHEPTVCTTYGTKFMTPLKTQCTPIVLLVVGPPSSRTIFH